MDSGGAPGGKLKIKLVLAGIFLILAIPLSFEYLADNSETPNATEKLASDYSNQKIEIITAYACEESICFELRAEGLNTRAIPTSEFGYSIGGQNSSITPPKDSALGFDCSSDTELDAGEKCLGTIPNTACTEGDELIITTSWGAKDSAKISGCAP